MQTGQGTFQHAEGVAFRRLSGESGAVLLNLQTGAYHRINHSGVIIWELLESPSSPREIAEGLAPTASREPEELLEDVVEFLNDLAGRDLVVKTS